MTTEVRRQSDRRRQRAPRLRARIQVPPSQGDSGKRPSSARDYARFFVRRVGNDLHSQPGRPDDLIAGRASIRFVHFDALRSLKCQQVSCLNSAHDMVVSPSVNTRRVKRVGGLVSSLYVIVTVLGCRTAERAGIPCQGNPGFMAIGAIRWDKFAEINEVGTILRTNGISMGLDGSLRYDIIVPAEQSYEAVLLLSTNHLFIEGKIKLAYPPRIMKPYASD
jgi:hypothetical protein